MTYAFIDSGLQKLGTDVILVGIIYNSQKVVPVGTAATISIGAFSSSKVWEQWIKKFCNHNCPTTKKR
ncbi:hypothetical protein [Methanosarcina siciliae]|uniref:hypothetical protein n=1 Tax=Methanosarcina siciliae TaxID=38027 RepID=UPI0012E009F1|nr:hypothetical protein [Methanosarcina siciliae]